MKITAEMREMQRAGVCTSPGCGKWESARNTAGQCCSCHNQQYYAREKQMEIDRKRLTAEGRTYWDGRGIEIGEKVMCWMSSVFSPAGAIVYGTAKVGSCGAYVLAWGKKTQPQHWEKIKGGS